MHDDTDGEVKGWASVPKVELHTHLDCSIGYEVARRLTPDLSLEEFEDRFVAPTPCQDLTEFLACVAPSVSMMQTHTALRLSVQSLFRRLADDGVVYAEVRFAPLLHLAELSPESVIETVLDEMKAQESEHHLRSGLILCTLRHFDEAQSLATARLVSRYAADGVVALDIAGDEAGFGLEPHRAAFQMVNDSAAHTTAHAGEARAADSVWETLSLLHPERIGHGVRSVDDARLVDRLVEDGIHLEVCPAVNLQIQIYPDLQNHPVDELRRRGVRLSINTDGRTVVGTSLNEDYARLEATFGWGASAFGEINANAAEASFADDETKSWLGERLAIADSHNGRAAHPSRPTTRDR